MGLVAIVTGSDSGIDKASAVALAEAGYDVGITWHEDEEGIEITAKEIAQRGRRVECRRLDLTRLPQAADVVDELAEALGGLDVFVNNAAARAGASSTSRRSTSTSPCGRRPPTAPPRAASAS